MQGAELPPNDLSLIDLLSFFFRLSGCPALAQMASDVVLSIPSCQPEVVLAPPALPRKILRLHRLLMVVLVP